MEFKPLLADRTKLMEANAIREILKVVSDPGIISLAGGIPSPESFPMDIFQDLFERVLVTYGPQAFQYDLTEGFMPLREQVSCLLEQRGITLSPDQVHITSGSQGVLDSAAKLMITKGDKIALESPTYLGAISAFNPYEPEYVAMETDDHGLIPESLEATLNRHSIKFIYLVPTFQNPTGRSLSMERRARIAEIIQAHNALLIEDDPYSALRYRGEALPPIKTLAPDHVIYVSTLSKVFAPGLRIGFYAAPKFLARGFTVSPSQGGMFLWVTGPEGLDGLALYRKAIENEVAFVPGKFFYTDPDQGLETMRLNYTMADETTLELAVEKLGQAARDL